MALKINTSKETIRVIAKEDESISVPEEMLDSAYDTYIKTLNENELMLRSEPTRFIMSKHLSQAAHETVMGKQLSIGEDGKPKFNLAYMMEEVRCSLVGIENPTGCESPIKFEKDPDGFASSDLIAFLQEAGVLQNLFNARQNAITKRGGLHSVSKKN